MNQKTTQKKIPWTPYRIAKTIAITSIFLAMGSCFACFGSGTGDVYTFNEVTGERKYMKSVDESESRLWGLFAFGFLFLSIGAGMTSIILEDRK